MFPKLFPAVILFLVLDFSLQDENAEILDSSLKVEKAEKLKILSFGGNGNIGSAVLSHLIETNRFDITIVTRGGWYWDSATRIKPYVETLKCDRNYQPACAAEKNATDCDINALRQCPELMKKINETEKFDMVIDFSGYEPKWIHDNCEVLKDKVGLYLYISTDSVYEVSRDKPTRRPSKETDAVRPSDEKEVKLLKKKDPYGHYKLSCEEALVYYQEKKNGFPWVALRLADVIGPRDTTSRWWVYQLWVKFYSQIDRPIFMPGHVADRRESLTFVEDVGPIVLRIFDLGSDVWNQVYNIALDDEFSLSNILLRLRDEMGVEEVLGDSNESEDSFYNYPTVFSGPMDITKAKEKLGFSPTPTDEAMKRTVEFYEEAFIKFPSERDEILSELMNTVIPKKNRDAVYIAIDKELTRLGHKEDKYRQKRKGDLGSLPSVKAVQPESSEESREESSEEDTTTTYSWEVLRDNLEQKDDLKVSKDEL